MLRRSILTIVLATALFSLALYIAGSPATTAMSLGLLMFGATAVMMVGWQDLKKSIVDEVDEARRKTMLGSLDHETVQEQQPQGTSPRPVDPVVTFPESRLVDTAVTQERPLFT
jgi:hypothetical protein